MTVEEAFAQYVPHGLSQDECWRWQGPLSGSGYGGFQSRGKRVVAHRAALESATDEQFLDALRALRAGHEPEPHP